MLDHYLLAKKLAAFAMPFELFRLIMAIITGRVYRLKSGNLITNGPISTAAGVPQELHCGPVLFSLYTAELPSIIRRYGCLMYADDTKIWKEIRNPDGSRQLREDIDALQAWAIDSGLILNRSKTVHVSYGPKTVETKYRYGRR